MTLAETIDSTLFQDISFTRMLIQTALTVVLGYLLAGHYRRFAHTLTNRRRFARVLVFVSLTTLLMISVVKSSLALSLGLVGALSIIRFRTPIKEPEDLAYLFLAIAVGVGIGANQIGITLVVYGVVLICLSLRALRRNPRDGRLLLNVTLPLPAPAGEDPFAALQQQVTGAVSRVDLRRVDRSADALSATFVIDADQPDTVSRLLAAIPERWPRATVTLVDQDSLE